MKKEDYIIPNEMWLTNEFSRIPFGIMRPAEIEVILSFFLIYHNGNDIEAGEEKLAVKYRISETKARKLKIEFAERYGNKNNIARIIASYFENGEIPFELSEDQKYVSFILKDPYELKYIKQDLIEKRIVYHGDFERKLIKLSIPKFIEYMAIYHDEVRKSLNKLINGNLDKNRRNNKVYWESLSINNKIDKLKDKYEDTVIEGILSLVKI
ncbi:MAG: hypothetical protein LBD37_10600 [Treponema sp.]|jgi:hypothetical protein|nr:hypothetical protein [Treponema sp.]